MRKSMISGLASADWRLGQMMLCERGLIMPGLKPLEKPVKR